MEWPDLTRRLREWREQANLTQPDVAERLGISKQHVSNMEVGRRGVPPELLGRWVQIFGLKWVSEIVPANAVVSIRPPMEAEVGDWASAGAAERATLERIAKAMPGLASEDRELLERWARLLPHLPRAARAAMRREVEEWETDVLPSESAERA